MQQGAENREGAGPYTSAVSARAGIGNLLTIERHATLLRVTALVLKAAKLFKPSKGKQHGSSSLITAEMLSEAKIVWIKDTQQYLTSQSTFKQLDRFKLFMDENGI